MTYTDVLNIYGMSRAGFVPQLFSIRLPSPEVVFELLTRAGAKALIYDSSFASIVSDCPVPSQLAVNPIDVDVSGVSLPDLPQLYSEEDIAFVFHTSGSTSGSPKLVPCNYRWFTSTIQKSQSISKPRSSSRPDVTVWMGSMCHIAQNFSMSPSLSSIRQFANMAFRSVSRYLTAWLCCCSTIKDRVFVRRVG